MYISDLALDDFRSYRHAVVRLEPGVTVLVGSNGQGKTNLVEAVAYLATLSSHRAGSDVTLVRHEGGVPAGPAVVRVRAHDAGREFLVDLEIVAGRANRARLNRDPVRPRQVAGIVQTVVFAPEDLALVRAEPGVRRRFLDELATQLHPTLAVTRAEHERVLRQRGALLKQLRPRQNAGAAATLEVWDQQLAALAAELILARRRLVDHLAEAAREAYFEVAGQARPLSLHYRCRSVPQFDEVPTEQLDAEQITAALIAQMADRRDEELARAVNLVGAHRDDLELNLDGLPVKNFASHGETWSVALALKVASYRTLVKLGFAPILILDDVFAELDTQRRDAVARLAAAAEQVLVTAAVAADVPEQLRARVLHVSLDASEGTLISEAGEAS